MSTTGSGSIKGKSALASRRGQNPDSRLSESSTNTTDNEGGGGGTQGTTPTTEPFEWDTDSELIFYKILINIRPIGINRHFNMMVIYDKFVKELNRDPKTVSVDDLWKKLRTLYNLEKLESNPESVNPNERLLSEEHDYELPKEYSSLIEKERIKERQLSPSPTSFMASRSTNPGGGISSKSSKKH